MTKMTAKDLITNIILVILSITLIIFGGMLIDEIADYSRSYNVSVDTYIYRIKEGDYGRVVEATYQNRTNGVKETEDLAECYAVSDYFESAFLYRVYQTRDLEKAKQYEEEMADALSRMGELTYVADDIRERLELP